MEHSENLSELFKALAEFQGKIESIKRTAENPFFKSSYSDLAAVWDTIRTPMAEHGLSVIQPMESNNGDIYVVTILGHTSGQWIKGKLKLTPVKQDPQGVGSAITYGRRYSLMGILGLSSEGEDDDGEEAMGRAKKKPEPEKQKPKPKEKPPKKDFDFMASMRKAKNLLGDETYHNVLGVHGYEHCDQVPEESRELLLGDLRIEAKRLQEHPSDSTGA